MSYTVKEADLSRDRDDLLLFLEHNYESVDLVRFNWLYKNNTANQSICFILKTDLGEIVGMNGVFTRQLKTGNKIITVANAIDLLVDKKHRTVGPALQLQRTLLTKLAERGIHIIFGFPLPSAQLILRRPGYHSLGTRQRWNKPLNSYFLLNKYMPSVIAKYISPITNVLLLLRTGELFKRIPTEYICNTNDIIDTRFDLLWKENYSLFSSICDRSYQFLKWRFVDFPNSPYKTFTLTDNTKKLQGYVIYRIDAKIVTIVDLLAGETDLVKLLLFEFSRHMRKANLNYLSFFYLGSPKISSILKQCGFLQRPEDSKFFLYINETKEQQYSSLRNSDSWFITDADKDV